MPDNDTIRPLKDVWLRPRRVFRELAARPVGLADYLLAAAQGVATSIAFSRTQLAGAHVSASEVLGSALLFGPVGGVLSMVLFAAVYARFGTRAGATAARNQVIHVLAYGGIPVAASLLLWGFTALFVGDAAIVDAPGGEVDGFVAFVLRAQFTAYVLLLLWSVVLQVMGLSEIFGFATRKAFGIWVLGQVLALMLALFLSALIAILFPGILPSTPH